jgi:hypothetical protein
MAGEHGAQRQRRAALAIASAMTRRLLPTRHIGVAAACAARRGAWVFVDIEGRDVPTEVLNGWLPGFLGPVQPGRYRVFRYLSGA